MPSGSLPASPPGPPPTSSTSASPITPRSTPASLTPIPRYVLGALRLLHATTALARTRLRLMPIPVPPTKSAILMTTIVSRVQEFSLLLSFLADGHPKSARVKTCAGPSGGEAARALEAQAWGGANGEPPVQGRMFRRMPISIWLELSAPNIYCVLSGLPVGAAIQHTRRWWAANPGSKNTIKLSAVRKTQTDSLRYQISTATRPRRMPNVRRATIALYAIPVILLLQSLALAQDKLLTVDAIYDPDNAIKFGGTLPRGLHWLQDGQHYLEFKPPASGAKPQLCKVEAMTGASVPFYDVAKMESALGRAGISAEEAGKLARRETYHMNPAETAVLINHGDHLYYYALNNDSAVRLTSDPAHEVGEEFS